MLAGRSLMLCPPAWGWPTTSPKMFCDLLCPPFFVFLHIKKSVIAIPVTMLTYPLHHRRTAYLQVDQPCSAAGLRQYSIEGVSNNGCDVPFSRTEAGSSVSLTANHPINLLIIQDCQGSIRVFQHIPESRACDLLPI